MIVLVKLSAARELVNAGAITQAEVIGLDDGWAVRLQTHNLPRMLATKQDQPRRFGTFESALKVLRELGVQLDRLRVDAAQWQPQALTTRRRPDRSAAMKLKDVDARYTVMLREAVEQARSDSRPALASAEAKQQMDAFKAAQRARLDAAMEAGKARS